MNYRKVAVLLLAVGVVFAVASLLSAAEPRKSHRPLPGSPGMFDENELAQRLQAAQDLSLLRALADKMLKDPKNFNLNDKKKQQLLEKLLKDQNVRDLLKDKDKTDEIQRAFRDALNNPNLTPEQLEALRKQFEKISPEKRNELLKEIEQNPGRFNLDKKDVEELKKLVEQAANGKVSEQTEKKWAEIFNKLSQNRNLPSGEIDIEALKQALPRLAPPGPEAPREPPPIQDSIPLDPPKPADAKPNTPDAPMPPEPPSDSPENTTETLLRLADWVQDIDPDDELFGRMADLLRDVANGEGFDNSWAMETLGKGSDLIGWLAHEDWLPTEQKKVAGSWFENLSKAPGMVSMPSTPSIPSVSGGLPSVSATFESEHLARIFIWAVLLLLLGGAALWMLLRYRGLNRSKDDLAASWPVRPGDVATRGDLVRAFEYLALLLLGVHAKHWHHLDLGKRLGDSSPNAAEERRRAANQLAHLYELARYAPEDELLPESDLAAARRDLSFLAGAGAA